jgi:hypothetical protein
MTAFLNKRLLENTKIELLSYQLINNSKQIVEVNIIEDPKYHIADDILD